MSVCLKRAAAAGVMACVMAGGASAGTVTATTVAGALAPGLFQDVDYTYFTDNVSGQPAGAIGLTNDDTLESFLAWCIDLDALIGGDTTYSFQMSVPSQISTGEQGNLDKLFTAVYADVDTAVEAAGFQLAIWEIITDSDFGQVGGDFRTVLGDGNTLSNPYDYAALYLSTTSSATAMGAYNLTFLDGQGVQDLVTATPVPLPAAVWMLGAGIAGLGAMGARRKR
jgi:hypothetical protein